MADEVRGDGEADALEAAVAAEDGGIDAEETAVDVDEGAAGVAGIDGGVGLDEVFVALDLGEDADVAALGADDAAGDGFADAEGIADGEDAVADFGFRAVGEGDGGKIFRVDFDDGEVGLGIAADDLGGEFAAVGERDRHEVGAVDDVVVGHHVAVGADDDAGAEAVLWLRAHLGEAIAEELAEGGMVEAGREVGAAGGDALGLGLGGDFHDARGDALHDGGEAGGFELAAGDGGGVAFEVDGGFGGAGGGGADEGSGEGEEAEGGEGGHAGFRVAAGRRDGNEVRRIHDERRGEVE